MEGSGGCQTRATTPNALDAAARVMDAAGAVSARVASPGDLSSTGGMIEQSDELNNGRGARGEPLWRVVRVTARKEISST